MWELTTAIGEYLYFVDCDDYIELDVIEYLYNLCKKYNVKMATCKPMEIYNYNYKTNNINEKIQNISSKEMIKKILLSEENAGTIWNKLIKKELFNNIRFENRIINDVTVTYKICIEAEQIAYSNQKKYYYLRHKNSITGKGNEERSIDLYKACIERYEYIKKIYPNFIENDIGLILIIIHIYCCNGDKLKKYLEEKNAIKLIRSLFSNKILKAKVRIKEKIKILLFVLNPKLYKLIREKYKKLKYQKLTLNK